MKDKMLSNASEVAEAKSLLAKEHLSDDAQRDEANLDSLEYDEPGCNWSPGEEEDDCGEGLACPPCS